ncbi:MAG: SH3 domain-containing protein, partial [Clostridiales bacterium]|nr:SH3 domain-containing protein [Clostridiales bacterium]
DWQYWAQCPYCTDDTTSASTTSSGSTAATDAAKSYDKSLAGTYKTTANLNMRSGAGTDKTILVTLPKGQAVTCYGYYTTYSGTDWYYVVSTYSLAQYTGYCSSKYLDKQ